MQLTGVARFRVEEELKVATAYRQCRVSYEPFADDFTARKGEEEVDRRRVLESAARHSSRPTISRPIGRASRRRRTKRWSTRSSMMAPYGAAEKQALLEAPDLKTRAEILIAITEIELAKKTTGRRAAVA